MTHVVPEDPGSSEQIMRRTTKHTPHNSLAHWLIGRPLQTADAPHQTIGKAVGLAVFASDALSSTAYAGQEILVILAAAGTVAFGYIFPISVAIVILLAIVTLSYEQTIHAYPDGGGAYIVARDNLGDIPALMAAAALLTDYVLTVSVSIASGVAQIVSAYAGLFPFRVYTRGYSCVYTVKELAEHLIYSLGGLWVICELERLSRVPLATNRGGYFGGFHKCLFVLITDHRTVTLQSAEMLNIESC